MVDADPVTTQVIRSALASSAEQMKLQLQQTGFSQIIYDGLDFACALYDRELRLLAQARTFPMFLGTLNFAIEASVKRSGGVEALAEGDVLFSSYAYDIGSHANDSVVIVPGFRGGELVGYAAIKAHQSDIGGKDPYITDSTDNFQEGAIFPGVKVFRGGERQEDVYRTMLANSRLPENFHGDLYASIGAAQAGIANVLELIEKHGAEAFWRSVERMLDHGEALVRKSLEAVADGRYAGTGALDSDGLSDDPVPFEVTVEIAGSDAVVDFTNAAAQTRGPVNSPLPSTVSAARFALTSLVARGESVNEGMFRPIEVRTRPGTIFQPIPPAACYLYLWAGAMALDVIHLALADAIPALRRAGSGGDAGAAVFWGTRPDGEYWINGVDHPCGQGALPDGDGGAPTLHISVSGEQMLSTEVWEAEYPAIMYDRYQMVPDSGGAGRFAGGLGVEVHYRAREDCFATVISERTKTPSWPLGGGRAGVPSGFRVRYPDGTVRKVSKVTGIPLPAGAVGELSLGGGAGYGPPGQREPAAVLADIDGGYLSSEAAHRHYPHVDQQASPDEPGDREGGRGMRLDEWIAAYGSCWNEKAHSRALVAQLFTEDAVCREQLLPLPENPRVGHEAIFDYFESENRRVPEAHMVFGRPIVDGSRVAVEWWATGSDDEGTRGSEAGVLALRFAPDGRCSDFRDCWQLVEGTLSPWEGWTDDER